LDALEVLEYASVRRCELAHEEPRPVASQAGVAESLEDVVVPGDDPGPQRLGVVDGGLAAHAVQQRVGARDPVGRDQFAPEIDVSTYRRERFGIGAHCGATSREGRPPTSSESTARREVRAAVPQRWGTADAPPGTTLRLPRSVTAPGCR